MKKYICFLAAAFTTSAANADSSYTLAYQSLDTTLSAGGVSVSGDGTGLSFGWSTILDDWGIIGSVSRATGTIGSATYSIDATSLGAGYKISDTLDKANGSGSRVLLGLGYTVSNGDATISGTTYTNNNNYFSLIGQVEARLSKELSIASTVNADLEGNADPTFGISIGYDVTESSDITIGYATNKTTKSGLTTEQTGVTIGWTTHF